MLKTPTFVWSMWLKKRNEDPVSYHNFINSHLDQKSSHEWSHLIIGSIRHLNHYNSANKSRNVETVPRRREHICTRVKNSTVHRLRSDSNFWKQLHHHGALQTSRSAEDLICKKPPNDLKLTWLLIKHKSTNWTTEAPEQVYTCCSATWKHPSRGFSTF